MFHVYKVNKITKLCIASAHFFTCMSECVCVDNKNLGLRFDPGFA